MCRWLASHRRFGAKIFLSIAKSRAFFFGKSATCYAFHVVKLIKYGQQDIFVKLKGVCYDAGYDLGFNWRPHFDPRTARRELEIIEKDLNCNAVKIGGLDVKRLLIAAEAALDQGLEVWLSPAMWDKSPEKTLTYITKTAEAAESLRQGYPNKMTFIIGFELTLFMQGIVEGKNFSARMKNPTLISHLKKGDHNKLLNYFLAKANASVREVYHGKVTYASLIWETIDWSLFDYVSVDHYRIKSIEDKYIEMLKPSFSYNKPVVITEFGYSTCHNGIGSEGFLSSSGLGETIIDQKSQYLHQIPLLGRFVRPHLNGSHVRDETWQARKLIENLDVLEKTGVEGAFISQFISQITPYANNPRYDLDMASSSLVKYYDDGKHGTTYQDMTWDPKESFKAVSKFYSEH